MQWHLQVSKEIHSRIQSFGKSWILTPLSTFSAQKTLSTIEVVCKEQKFRDTIWSIPPLGWNHRRPRGRIKCNVDATLFNNNTIVGYGMCFRDSLGTSCMVNQVTYNHLIPLEALTSPNVTTNEFSDLVSCCRSLLTNNPYFEVT